MKIDITNWQDEQLEVVPAVEETQTDNQRYKGFQELWSLVPEYEKVAYYDNDINVYMHYLMIGRLH